jgi:uncharacterized OB-fold protein
LKPLPRPTALSKPFWEGTRRRQLLLQRCRRCGAYRFTPQVLCRACYAEEYDWAPASGRGRVYSYTAIHQPQTPAFADDVPYLLAVVALEEGPLMLTNLVDCAPQDVTIDLPVRVHFEDASEEITLYKFRPDA